MDLDDHLILEDGSSASIQPNGRIVSGISWLGEFTDSDGTVYKCDGPSEQRVHEHRTAVMKFKRSPVYWRQVFSLRRTVRAIGWRRHRGCGGRPRGRRTAARRARATRAGPDSDEPEPLGLALWRHSKYGLVNRLLAAFLDRREVFE